MMDGVVRVPSAFSITLVLPFSMMATQEFVVPRSMPMIFPMMLSFQLNVLNPYCQKWGVYPLFQVVDIEKGEEGRGKGKTAPFIRRAGFPPFPLQPFPL